LKVVYVVGPYTGETHDSRSHFEISRHILDASEMARALCEQGIGYFCPHLHGAHFESIAPDVKPNYWYELDNFFLDFCHAGLFLPAWGKSTGSRDEHQRLKDQGKPIFFARHTGKVPEDLLKWAKGGSNG